MPTFGREPIYTSYDVVDSSNILQVLSEAYPSFTKQRNEIHHLFEAYRGKQCVLCRTKTVRPEINNRIVRNHALEIVSFKVGYLLSEPIKYVQRCADDSTDAITQLNDFMFMESKDTKDKEIADHFNICGVAYRLVLPNEKYDGQDPDSSPFNIYTLDPEDTFVIRHSGLGRRIVCGVHIIRRRDEQNVLREITCVYTPDKYYEIERHKDQRIITEQAHALGCVPIFEYINNEARLGSFEIVETLLDSINTLESNRLDGTEQAVQNLLMFKNCEIDMEGLERLRAMGAVNVKSTNGVDADIKSIVTTLNQADQQILMDSMYNTMLAITGMPAASSNVSDSSNNGAVFMRSGWSGADARAKDSEKLWRKSETEFLRLVLHICRTAAGLELNLKDIGIKFTRRNYEDIMSKSQTLVNMLSAGVHPKFALEQCGLFYDPSEVYKASEPYLRKWEYEDESEIDTTVVDEVIA